MAKQTARKGQKAPSLTQQLVLLGLLLLAAGILFALERAGVISLSDKTLQTDFCVSFVDVGQGDCIYIHSGESDMLIDAGEVDYGDRVVQYLTDADVKSLDYVIATHPHSDHIGGLPAVLDAFPVDTVVMSDIPDDLLPTTRSYERLLSAIDKNGAALQTAVPGEVLALDGASFEMLGPVKKDYNELNDFSVVGLLTRGTLRFLLTGDMSSDAENDMLKKAALSPVDVLKVGHHGSSSSSTKKFLKAVSPEYAVICCGEDNSYNHPNKNTVKRLLDVTDQIFRTDLQGTIVFTAPDGVLTVTTER